jgi:hypothetical protein
MKPPAAVAPGAAAEQGPSVHAELSALLACGVALALWSWAGRGRELVDRLSSRVCREVDVQRLDQSVALRRLGLTRHAGRPALELIYSFEFSVSGSDRHRGDISLVNGRPRWAHLDHPDGAVHIELA